MYLYNDIHIYHNTIITYNNYSHTVSWQLTSTHLSVVVEVWIEADRVVAGGFEVNERRRVWVILWEVDVELEAAVGVRRVGRSGDQHLCAQDAARTDGAHRQCSVGFTCQSPWRNDPVLQRHTTYVQIDTVKPIQRIPIITIKMITFKSFNGGAYILSMHNYRISRF